MISISSNLSIYPDFHPSIFQYTIPNLPTAPSEIVFDYSAPYSNTNILAAIAETGESQLVEGSEDGSFKLLVEPDLTVVVRSELDV